MDGYDESLFEATRAFTVEVDERRMTGPDANSAAIYQRAAHVDPDRDDARCVIDAFTVRKDGLVYVNADAIVRELEGKHDTFVVLDPARITSLIARDPFWGSQMVVTRLSDPENRADFTVQVTAGGGMRWGQFVRWVMSVLPFAIDAALAGGDDDDVRTDVEILAEAGIVIDAAVFQDELDRYKAAAG